jgi:hypothetical protein
MSERHADGGGSSKLGAKISLLAWSSLNSVLDRDLGPSMALSSISLIWERLSDGGGNCSPSSELASSITIHYRFW